MTVGDPLEIGLRLAVGFLCGAAVGIEREIHVKPAGLRTHALLALGSAMFTVVSEVGFTDPGGGAVASDPGRVAAQVVSGVGFLGAGAIIKDGFSIRGLTTAASLWTTAAIGLAAGAGVYWIALLGTALAAFSLWPLRAIVHRLRPEASRSIQVRLELAEPAAMANVVARITAAGVPIVALQSERLAKRRYEVVATLGASSVMAALLQELNALHDVSLLEVIPEDG